ncbi:hypothetical protein GCM10023169_39020 [Georgenia halophila]|uniref:Signal transduction histidine-protein kinase/phosphatase MprB n=1 Tax=Georgenia halophila TaxID=620889 RepID=A0ABP8LR21_9MICO
MEHRPTDRPLDRVGSIKIKIGLLVGLSVVVAALVAEIGNRADVPAWLTVPVTVAAALAVTQWLARGMTAPLREMTDAAARMATGDYSQRVTDTSADEVGRLGQAFNTMAVDLATADQQRRRLVATVSHELRTPLAAQRALLENLVDGVVRPDDEALQSALGQSERLSELVGDLLDLARIDAGAAPLDVGRVEVAELLDRSVAEAGVGGRPVRYEVVVDPAGLVVDADAARLAQVAANLLDNAARHSPADGTVTVRAGVEGADRWFLEVSDSGPGIPAGQEEHVFRFGTADDGGGGGTGLGLAIAAWVCELHGGSIAALAPVDGSGARVRAVLPRRPVSPQGPSETGAAETDLAEPAAAETDLAEPTAAAKSQHAETPQLASAEVSQREEEVSPYAEAVTETADGRGIVDTLFRDVWPDRGPATAPVALLGSTAIGVVAALTLPFRDIGVGVLLVLLLGGALVLRHSARLTRPWTVLTTALCLGLGSFVVLRDADWLSVLALLVVAVLVTTALTDARRFLPVLAGPAAWVLAAVRGLPLLGRTLNATTRHRLLWPVLRTAVLSLVALVVFGGLFASGDAIFGTWVAGLVPDVDWDNLTFRTFVLVLVWGLVLTGCYVALNPPQTERLALPVPSPVTRAWEWLVPVGLVVAVFAGFVAAQATAMWGGHEYLEAVTGLTYAEYVHQGFGQLTLATALTLATVAVVVRKAPRAGERDRLLLRVTLGVLCLLTLIVVASALYRMAVYQEAYGFTVLRVLVDAFELWLGLIVVLVMVAGVRLTGWWLPRAALLSGTVFLLVIGLANPEGWVAEQNIERYEETGDLDLRYLSSLSDDATPAIVEGLPTDLVGCVASWDAASWDAGDRNPDDLLAWNLGRARAQEYVRQVHLDGGNSCPPELGGS